ncbi:AAA family ATPase [Candidatus Zixiibacteriota bacterium]
MSNLRGESVGSIKLALDRYLRDPGKRVGQGLFEEKISRIGQIFVLDEGECALIRFAALLRMDQMLTAVFDERSLERVRRSSYRLLSRLLSVTPDVVWKSLRPGSRLFRMGMFFIHEFNPRYAELCPELSDPLLRVLTDTSLSAERMVEGFAQPIPAPILDHTDYRHMAGELGIVSGLLQHAWSSGSKGLNILIYGPPGFGKTQFARVTAGLLEASAYSVPVIDDLTGDVCESNDRRLIHSALQYLCSGEEKPLLIMDEADNLLNDSDSPFRTARYQDQSRKMWLTQVLEENRIPVIWIVNQQGQIHGAIKRRFQFSVSFSELGRDDTIRIWNRELQNAGESLQTVVDDIEYSLHSAALSPGEIAGVVDAWNRIPADDGPDLEVLDCIIEQKEKLQHGIDFHHRKLAAIDTRYNPDMIALEDGYDPDKIYRSLMHFYGRAAGEASKTTSRAGQMSLLFYGPSGAGKTEFVKYLGRMTGRLVQMERISDLLSMWVGESEKNIARAFLKATRQGNILLLDELDALAIDRGRAVRSWESSLVSELLQQVENHQGVLIGCTNLVDVLDSAFYRRFSLKVGFEGIHTDRRLDAVHGYFSDLVPGEIDESGLTQRIHVLSDLYPGDLKIARQRCESEMYLGEELSWERVVTEVEREAGFRDAQAHKIGFQG